MYTLIHVVLYRANTTTTTTKQSNWITEKTVKKCLILEPPVGILQRKNWLSFWLKLNCHKFKPHPLNCHKFNRLEPFQLYLFFCFCFCCGCCCGKFFSKYYVKMSIAATKKNNISLNWIRLNIGLHPLLELSKYFTIFIYIYSIF